MWYKVIPSEEESLLLNGLQVAGRGTGEGPLERACPTGNSQHGCTWESQPPLISPPSILHPQAGHSQGLMPSEGSTHRTDSGDPGSLGDSDTAGLSLAHSGHR
jgi:hypothetical protein